MSTPADTSASLSTISTISAMTSDEHLMLVPAGLPRRFQRAVRTLSRTVIWILPQKVAGTGAGRGVGPGNFPCDLEGIERYEPRATFRTYVYAIAFRQLSGEWRRAKREAVPLETDPAIDHDPDEAVWLRRALQQLDPAHREVLLLREFEQLSYDEIAGVLRIPVNTVRSRLFRGRVELKALLSPDRKEHEGSKRLTAGDSFQSKKNK